MVFYMCISFFLFLPSFPFYRKIVFVLFSFLPSFFAYIYGRKSDTKVSPHRAWHCLCHLLFCFVPLLEKETRPPHFKWREGNCANMSVSFLVTHSLLLFFLCVCEEGFSLESPPKTTHTKKRKQKVFLQYTCAKSGLFVLVLKKQKDLFLKMNSSFGFFFAQSPPHTPKMLCVFRGFLEKNKSPSNECTRIRTSRIQVQYAFKDSMIH